MSIGIRRKGKKASWEISLPEELALRVESLHYDRGAGRVIYGSRSQLVTELLEKWASEREAEIRSSIDMYQPKEVSSQ